jgi:stage II sporulation protein D
MDNGSLVCNGTPTDTDIQIHPDKGAFLSINERSYRGGLHVIADSRNDCFDVINLIDLESYLAGVVGSEMPGYWEPQALMAQAIASRTYSLYICNTFGRHRSWDVRRTEASQVYGGMSAETSTVWDAVAQTKGLVMTCPQGDSRKPEIFPAYFSSVCGNHTESSSQVFGDSYAALDAVACPFCQSTAPKRFYEWKPAAYSRTEVSDKLINRYSSLKRLEQIVDIVPSKISTYDDFQRVTQVTLIGSNGQKQSLEAENFRLTIDPTGRKIRSTAFVVTKTKTHYTFEQGRGFGHSVGLCQYGALGMARQGYDFIEILNYYYPESQLHQLYTEMQ